LDRLQKSYSLMRPAFEQVVAAVESVRFDQEDSRAGYQQSREGALAQLMVLSEQMVNEGVILEDEAQKEISKVRLRFILVSLIAVSLLIAGIGFILLLFGTTLVRSIKRLKEGAQAFSKDDLSYRVQIDTHDEMGELAATFNDMAKNLAKALSDLERDIGKRKLVERALRERNRELQQFASIASHDLSEPLRKIQTFGSLLETRSAGRLRSEERDYISRITGAAAWMRELLDGLLRYSRVDSMGREFVPTELEHVVKDAISEFQSAIQSTGARVTIEPLPLVKGDPIQLKLMFRHLIANSVKYRRLSTQLDVKIYAEKNNSTGRLFVEDNGIGFDEKYLDKIFQPFQRLHGKDEYSGVGIGLAICRKIVERHGGTITARSTPGKGSTFIVTLPVNPAE
ncbi:MAG: ATP-binding protein, partial [Desulfobacterales bacterium]|nr:ATP-binding protein [Desulfobacterales bacterium]